MRDVGWSTDCGMDPEPGNPILRAGDFDQTPPMGISVAEEFDSEQTDNADDGDEDHR